MIEFTNLDPFATATARAGAPGRPGATELYRSGELLIDFYATSTLLAMRSEGDLLVMSLRVTWVDPGPPPRHAERYGAEYSLHFDRCRIVGMSLDGAGPDDLGQLEELVLVDEARSVVGVRIASSIDLTLACETVALRGL